MKSPALAATADFMHMRLTMWLLFRVVTILVHGSSDNGNAYCFDPGFADVSGHLVGF